MTPLLLQESLRKELEKITSNMLFENKGQELKKISVYNQTLPLQTGSDRDSVFPFIVVEMESGGIPESGEYHEIKTMLYIGVYYHNRDKQGHKAILNIIQRIYERFAKDSILDSKYKALPKFEWILQEGGQHPQYFGGVELNWQTAVIRREDEFV